MKRNQDAGTTLPHLLSCCRIFLLMMAEYSSHDKRCDIVGLLLLLVVTGYEEEEEDLKVKEDCE